MIVVKIITKKDFNFDFENKNLLSFKEKIY